MVSLSYMVKPEEPEPRTLGLLHVSKTSSIHGFDLKSVELKLESWTVGESTKCVLYTRSVHVALFRLGKYTEPKLDLCGQEGFADASGYCSPPKNAVVCHRSSFLSSLVGPTGYKTDMRPKLGHSMSFICLISD